MIFLDRIGAAEKKVSINFSKAKTKLCLSLHYNRVIVICLLMEKDSISLKLVIKMPTYLLSLIKKANLKVFLCRVRRNII